MACAEEKSAADVLPSWQDHSMTTARAETGWHSRSGGDQGSQHIGQHAAPHFWLHKRWAWGG